jgi:sugar lactone lactonase YvrE
VHQRRLVRLAAAAALVAAWVATLSAPLATAEEEDDDPIGYTLGVEFRGGAVTPICDFFSVELDSGELHRIAAPVFCGDGLTFDEDGTLYAYRNPNVISGTPIQTELMIIDLDDGAQHVIGPLPGVQTGDGGMTFDEDGNLWLYGRAPADPDCGPTLGACLWKVDPDDASTRFIGSTATAGVFGLTGDCEEVLAITSEGFGGPAPSGSQLAEVDTETAALEDVVDVPGVSIPQGLDFDERGRLWALSLVFEGAPGPYVHRIDPDDGSSTRRQVTLNGSTYDGALFGLAVDPIECDEPEPPVPPPAPAPAPAAVAVEPVFTG